MDNWPEAVRRVAGVLQESRVEARIEEFGEGTPTAEDAANAAGAPVEQIVKTLVFSCDGRAIVVMVPGDKRADTGRCIPAGGERVKFRTPGAVEDVTGFLPARGPLSYQESIPVLIDQACSRTSSLDRRNLTGTACARAGTTSRLRVSAAGRDVG